MLYLAYLILILHFLWILFLIFGIFLVFIRPRLLWIHFTGLLFSLMLNLKGWYCPLTYLENYLYRSSGAHRAYEAPFLIHYIHELVYPRMPEQTIRFLEIAFVIIYTLVYLHILKRGFLSNTKRAGERSNEQPQ